MKKLKFSIIAFAVVAASVTSSAGGQTLGLTGSAKWADSAALEIDRASLDGNIDRLRSARTLLDQALVAFPNDPLLLYYEGYALYREAGILSGKSPPEKAQIPPLIQTARTKLEQSLAARPMAETHALLANILGQIIGSDPSTAPTLGPRVNQEMNAALSMGPNNPRVWLLRGIQSIYTPAQYGGGLQNAESQLNKAVQLFVTDRPSAPEPSWGKAEAYVWLGQVLQKENRKAEARTAYEKALALQKYYPWVTYSLLPSLDR